MKYFLDTDVFISAKNLHYGLDFCPAFWEWLIDRNRAGRVFSIDKVKDEIERGEDELAAWARVLDQRFFQKTSAKISPALITVSNWVNNNGYTPSAKDTFFQAADYWLIAHALTSGYAVVTHERPTATPNKVKIPNVCLGLDIKVMSPFEMLRHERARFVLAHNA
jgi:hypothetical protein